MKVGVLWAVGAGEGRDGVCVDDGRVHCQMACQLQLHHDHIDQGGHRRSSGLDDKVRNFAAQRVSDVVRVSQALERVIDLQQKLRIVTGARLIVQQLWARDLNAEMDHWV